MSVADGNAEEAKTTIRAAVTKAEHDAVKHVVRVKLGMTIDEFVRMSVDGQLKASTGKSLATLAEETGKRPKWVQGELF